MKTEAEIREMAADVDLCVRSLLQGAGPEASLEVVAILMTLEWVLGSRQKSVLSNADAIRERAREIRAATKARTN